MKAKGARGLAPLLGLVIVLAAGCAGMPGSPPAAEAAVAKSDAPRADASQLPAADLEALAAGNSAFALDLYGALRKQDGNLFFSPYSVSLALAMVHAGARGDTEAQMARVLHYTLPQERLHPAFNALDQQLASRGAGARGQDGGGFRLKLANSTWGQKGYQFLPQYLELLARDYGAELRLADFAKAPEPARLAINDWVKEQTEGKIPDLLPRGTIKDLTRLVLVNAVYFNAAWKYPFEKAGTRPRPFSLLAGRQVEVPMMSQTKGLAYARGEGYQAVELPYDGGELSLVVVLPDERGFQRFEASLDGARLDAALKALRPQPVALTMPKLAYDSSFALAETLSGLGMADAVTPGKADFSGMDGTRDLFISNVVHKAIVVVDEKGTEAAAATGAVIGITSAPVQQPVNLVVDRPFVFLIRDLKTGILLFVGRVLNPAG